MESEPKSGTIARNADQERDLIRRGYRFLAVPLTVVIAAGVRELVREARSDQVLLRPLAAGKGCPGFEKKETPPRNRGRG